jgi:L-threonylcarbamoyladenylate synthase
MVVGPEDSVDTDNTAFIGIDAPKDEVRLARLCDSVDEYARTLFAFFRECDRKGIKTIYCERVSEAGVGAALMDRIVRAAENGPPLSELDRDDS